LSGKSGTLYVVATPIGNLKDITLRAVETLRSVDTIACEDTRRTRKLLSHLGIGLGEGRRLISYYRGREEARAEAILSQLVSGRDVALVTDSGTPALSDPGFRLLRAAVASQIKIVPIPGPSAVVALLSVAGLPTDRFVFEGFLPRKRAKRLRRLKELRDETRTIVLFESPARIARTLQELIDVFGDRQAAIGREMTKAFEEIARGNLHQLAEMFSQRPVKGELTIAIAGKPTSKPTEAEACEENYTTTSTNHKQR